MLDDAQAQAGAAGVAGARRVDAVEALEDTVLLGGGDAHALVDDVDLDQAAAHPHPHAHAGVLRRVGDGVVEQVAHRGDEQVVVAVHEDVGRAADRDRDVLPLRGGAGAVHGLGDDVAHRDRRDLLQGARHLQAGQLDDLLHQGGQALRLRLHPLGEAAHRHRVVRGVLHRLRQQGERPDRRLELVRDVDDEVAADGLHAAGLGAVLGEHEQLVRADGRHPDLQQHRARADRPARQLQLLLADHPVATHLPHQVDDRRVLQGVVAHHPQRVRRRRRPHDVVVLVQDHRGRPQHREHADEPLVQLGGGCLGRPALDTLGEAEGEGRDHAHHDPEDARDDRGHALDDSVHMASVGRDAPGIRRGAELLSEPSPTVHLGPARSSPGRPRPVHGACQAGSRPITPRGQRCERSSRPSCARSATTSSR